MKRFKMSRKGSNRSFQRGRRTKRINIRPRAQRGGFRL